MPYRKILAAIDPHSSSKTVLEYAGALAKRLKSYLVVATAIPDLGALYRGPESKLQVRFDQELIVQAREHLNELCSKTRVVADEMLVLRGDADDTIANKANNGNFDLVIFGNHDRHGLEHYIGDFGLGLLHRAKCDLLAVRMEKRAQLKVPPVVAVAHDEDDRALLMQARSLFPRDTLQVIHVVRPAWFDYLLENPLFTLSKADRQQAETAIEQALRPLIQEYKPSELTLKFGTPSNGLENFSRSGGHQLIIMGSGSHNGVGWRVGSTAHNLLSQTKSDVLLVRPRPH